MHQIGIKCECSQKLPGLVLYNIHDNNFRIKLNTKTVGLEALKTDFSGKINLCLPEQKTTSCSHKSDIKTKRQKSKTWPLHVKDYCYNLQSKADYQVSKTRIQDFRWVGHYVVEKVLCNEIYLKTYHEREPNLTSSSFLEVYIGNDLRKKLQKTDISELRITLLSHRRSFWVCCRKQNFIPQPGITL